MMFLKYALRKNIPEEDFRNNPRQPSVILPHRCLFYVVFSDPIYLFSLLTTYLTTDGYEDCGEQLSYMAMTGLLY